MPGAATDKDDEYEDEEAGSGEDDEGQEDTTETMVESSKEEVVCKLTELIEEAIEIETMQCTSIFFDNIHTTIHIYNACALTKRIDVFSQEGNTRSWTVLNTLKDDICQCAKRYRLAFQALTRLGLPTDSELKPVGDNDLWGKDMMSLRKKGNSKREEPWFWLIGKPKECTDEQWQLEYQVHWFCTRALRDRLKEEVEILTAEFQRIITSFTKMDSIWRTVGEKKQEAILAEGGSPLVAQGFRSFAYRQAAMYQRLAHDARIHWSKAAHHIQVPRLLPNE
ncbi:hypothetical protein NP233_g12411 [Leucocoprinus birnbaumii]|uniref:Uncharacterized protein n=1 Tax=Leucocoprinus birnbaumii TaxID=56174 RepID=A0AAD5VIK7_9AGAR|nr:hypothetical protein NP233_g12411 [Leucocoprinus birnbaumii]